MTDTGQFGDNQSRGHLRVGERKEFLIEELEVGESEGQSCSAKELKIQAAPGQMQ